MTSVPTPVLFENFCRESTDLFDQEQFDGFKLDTQKFITPQLLMGHSINLGTTSSKAGYAYNFGPQFVFNGGKSMAMTRFNLDGKSTMARLHHKVNDSLDFSIVGSSMEGRLMPTVEVNKTFDDSTASGKIMFQGVWIAQAAYSQMLTRNLQAGADLTFIHNGLGVTFGTLGLRYLKEKNYFATTLARQMDMQSGLLHHQLKASFIRFESPRCTVGSELSFSPEMGTSSLRASYQATLNTAQVTTVLDTMGSVQTNIRSAQGYGACAFADFFNGKYKFGLSWQLQPQDEEQQKMMQAQGAAM